MTAGDWHSFPYTTEAYDYDEQALRDHWTDLHEGDREPWPDPERLEALCSRRPAALEGIADWDGDYRGLAQHLREAWRCFHRGDFHHAATLGERLGPLGAPVAAKATGIYATHLEPNADTRLQLWQHAATLAERAAERLPDYANTHYFYAFNIGRYSQGISIANALAQGLAGKLKRALDRALALEPEHADAHIASGLYHAEIIDKVGSLVGGFTYGARREDAIAHLDRAVALAPGAPIARLERAHGLLMLDRRRWRDEARRAIREAAHMTPRDAMERLDVEAASAELADFG